MNLPFFISAPAPIWPLWLTSFWSDMERDVPAALLLLCNPARHLGHLICFLPREGNRNIAQQMQGCFVGPSAATPESCKQHMLSLAVLKVEHDYELQGE